MSKTLTSIFIAVSLLMLDAHVLFCQQPVAAGQSLTAEASTKEQAQSGNATTSNSAPAQSGVPLDEKSQKVKRNVEKIGVAGRLTLYLKNGEELYGSVVSYDAESLKIAEVDLKQVITVQYKNIKKVREGYGNRDLFTGKRVNPPKGVKIGIIVGVIFLAFGLPIIGLAAAKD